MGLLSKPRADDSKRIELLDVLGVLGYEKFAHFFIDQAALRAWGFEKSAQGYAA